MKCAYCNGSILNSNWHDECRRIFCEDMLAQIQAHIKDRPNKPLPAKLAEAIANGRFTTLKEHQAERKRLGDLHARKQSWELAKGQAMTKFFEEWKKDHPDPPRF